MLMVCLGVNEEVQSVLEKSSPGEGYMHADLYMHSMTDDSAACNMAMLPNFWHCTTVRSPASRSAPKYRMQACYYNCMLLKFRRGQVN